MVAPNYAERRSELAKQIGPGHAPHFRPLEPVPSRDTVMALPYEKGHRGEVLFRREKKAAFPGYALHCMRWLWAFPVGLPMRTGGKGNRMESASSACV